MPDYGQKATDAEFRRLRAKINDVYRQAYKEIEQKGREFAQAHARREAQMRQMVADGKMTQADFDAWMRGQVFQGEQWQKKKQQMADTLYHADQVAQQMVNDSRYNVFAANANYMGYSLEHDRGIKTNFGLYDADSVRRLVKKEPDLLPPKKMVGKDKSYQWYNRQVQTAITQGIIQGESLDKIAHRIGKQTGETSMTAMLRNARTMQTGAQNAGRIEGLHQAQELGIKVKKQWMATLDSHTRDAHADLDGQIADVDEPFDSELGPIMYPGDPDADPANVWNCRCTLVYVYPEYPNSMERRDNETGENVGDMTYREWEEMKRGEEAEPIDIPEPEQEQQVEDDSFAGRLASEKLSPYSNELDYFEYAEQMQAWDGDRTQWIESVHPGTVIDMQSELSFDGEPHCSFAPIDNAVARLYEQVPLTADHSNLVLCDYDNARFHLPNGENDRRLAVDAIAQVFENEGQTVIAFRRDWMNHSLKESLEERQRMIDEEQVLPMVFPVASPEGVVMHEWGHTVHSHFLNAMCYDDPDAQKLWNWYRTLSKEDITTGLSEYAAVNFGEFTAECFAEMQTSNPRPMARQCWQYISGLIGRGY